MQFTMRGMFVAIAVFAVWLGVVAQGYRLFGPDGALASGACFFIVIAAVLRLCKYWRMGSAWQRASPIIVMAGALLAMIFLASEYKAGRVDVSWNRVQLAAQLQRQLNAQSAYEGIRLTYEYGRIRRGDQLVVEGTVKTQRDLNTLQCKVTQFESWNVQWDVEVDPETRRDN